MMSGGVVLIFWIASRPSLAVTTVMSFVGERQPR